jgi:hypothetical protein
VTRVLGAVFSEAEIADENLSSLGYGLFDALYLSRSERALVRCGDFLSMLLHRNIVCGASLALRATWKDRVLPFPDGVVHDEWIALVTAAHDSLRFIPLPLIRYRQHSSNQLGLPRITPLQRFVTLFRSRRPLVEGITRIRDLYEPLSKAGVRSDALDKVKLRIAHLERRLSMGNSRLMRLPAIAREIVNGGYARYSSGWRSAVRDLVAPM